MYKYIRDDKKNQLLKKKRGVGFEDVVQAVESKNILGRIKHPNNELYPNQVFIIFEHRGYPYVCPCLIQGSICRLITIFPNRKFKYLLQ